MFKEFFITEKVENTEIKKEVIIDNKKEKVEDILRNNGFKIKSVLITSFGKQIDFAKKYPDDEIKSVLKNFNLKIKDKSIFIIE